MSIPGQEETVRASQSWLCLTASSWRTACGTTTCPASEGRRSRREIRPSRISGELLTAKRLLTRKLRLELLHGHLDDRHFALGQLVEELQAAQTGQLGGLPLGGKALGVPFHGCRDPHIAR